MAFVPGQRPWSQLNNNWQGIFDLASNLPNVAGSPLQMGVPNVQNGDLAWVSSGPMPGLYLCVDPTAGAAIWVFVAGAGGGGGGLVPVADRRDHSINGASVDLFNTTQAILRTKTDAHPASAYTGGGTGNKSILGHFLPALLRLDALVSVEFTVLRITPEATFLPPLTNGFAINVLPYANLVVELDPAGAPGVYSIFVFGDVNNTLLLGAYSTPGLNQHRCVWTAASPGSGTMVVNDKGMATFPGPVIIVPVSQGPAQTVAAAWQSHAYSIAGILAVYPDAQIVNAYSADGGLPKSPTITSGVMMMTGSSGNTLQNAVQVLDWKLNGAPI